MIRMRLRALDTIHHAAFNKIAKCNLLHALGYTPDGTRLYTPNLLDLRSQVSSQDALKYTPGTLPSTLRVRSQVHSRACSQGRPQLRSMEHCQPA